MTPGYLLTRAAEADLRDIVRYTRRQWGDVQARRYLETLQTGAAALAAGEGRLRDMRDLHPGLLMIRRAHHYVFGLPRPGQQTLIIAILHERMDLIARVAGRLG